MHFQAMQQQMAEAEAKEREQAKRLAQLAGVADPADRLDPDMPATIRFGDEALADLIRRQARVEVFEEALAKLEGGEVDTTNAPVANVRELAGVGADLAGKLEAHGFDTAEKVASAAPHELTAVPGVGEKKAAELQEAARG